MPVALTVEERLTILEKELAELKQGAVSLQHKQNWIERIAGSFKDDPEFGEILRLGKAIRKADQLDDADGDA